MRMTTTEGSITTAGGVISCGWYCDWLCERCDYPRCASYMPAGVKPKVEMEADKQLKLFEI